jgi:hypothetical protein
MITVAVEWFDGFLCLIPKGINYPRKRDKVVTLDNQFDRGFVSALML